MIGLLVFSFTVVTNTLPGESIEYENYVANLTLDAKTASVAQFYPNMRYQNKMISYSISSECDTNKVNNILSAQEILEQSTILRFVQQDNGEIKYLCSEREEPSENKGHYIAGEGGPTGIVNTTLFSVITSGQVSLYRDERCKTPQVALHETLHALGFDHVTNKKDIMYPITECDQTISDAMIEAINNLYEIRTAPDLGIEYVDANQTGRYLNFYITIVNYGLDNSEDSSLTIYNGDEKVKTFQLGDIKMGTKKFLNVQNLKISGKADVVKFELNKEADDLYPENDFAEIYLKYE